MGQTLSHRHPITAHTAPQSVPLPRREWHRCGGRLKDCGEWCRSQIGSIARQTQAPLCVLHSLHSAEATQERDPIASLIALPALHAPHRDQRGCPQRWKRGKRDCERCVQTLGDTGSDSSICKRERDRERERECCEWSGCCSIGRYLNTSQLRRGARVRVLLSCRLSPAASWCREILLGKSKLAPSVRRHPYPLLASPALPHRATVLHELLAITDYPWDCWLPNDSEFTNPPSSIQYPPSTSPLSPNLHQHRYRDMSIGESW